MDFVLMFLVLFAFLLFGFALIIMVLLAGFKDVLTTLDHIDTTLNIVNAKAIKEIRGKKYGNQKSSKYFI